MKIKKNNNKVGLYLPTLFFASMLVETQVCFFCLGLKFVSMFIYENEKTVT